MPTKELLELERLFDYLTLEDPKTPKIQLDKPLSTISLFPKHLKYNSQIIKSVQMIGHFSNRNCQKNANLISATRVIIQLLSNQFLCFQFKDPNLKFQFKVYQLLHTYGGLPEHAFADYALKAPFDWKEQNLPYELNEIIYYQRLHRFFAEQLWKTLYANQSILEKTSHQTGVQVISLGCGTGEDLYTCYTKLTEKKISGKYIGIDFNQNNIKKAQQQYPETKYPIKFATFDFENLHKLKIQDDIPKIVIACGSLSRYVMVGTYPVAQVLQKVKTDIGADIVLIAGYTRPLITSAIANDIGFDVCLENFLHGTNKNDLSHYGDFYTLLKMTDAEEFEHAKIKSLKRSRSHTPNIIDLSLSATPLGLCQQFSTLEESRITTTQLDLSWSYLRNDQFLALIATLKEFPKLNCIILSGHEPWAKELIKQLKICGLYTIVQRKDCMNAYELPTLPVHQARQLNLYDVLPNTMIFKPGISISPNNLLLNGKKEASSTQDLKKTNNAQRLSH